MREIKSDHTYPTCLFFYPPFSDLLFFLFLGREGEKNASRKQPHQLTTAAAKAALRDFPKMSRKQIGNDDQSEGLRNFAKSGSEKKEGSRTEICFSGCVEVNQVTRMCRRVCRCWSMPGVERGKTGRIRRRQARMFSF